MFCTLRQKPRLAIGVCPTTQALAESYVLLTPRIAVNLSLDDLAEQFSTPANWFRSGRVAPAHVSRAHRHEGLMRLGGYNTVVGIN